MGNCCSFNYNILILGIGAAGKTTILYQLKDGDVVHTTASIGFFFEKIVFDDKEFNFWDLCGQNRARPSWSNYYNGANGIIFVVDASDRSLFQSAKEEFHQAANNPKLANIPILVYANKQDLDGAVNADKLESILELHVLDKSRYHIQESCAINGVGLNNGMKWLSDNISHKYF